MLVDPAVIAYLRPVRLRLARTTVCTLAASATSVLTAFQLAGATSHILSARPGLPWPQLLLATAGLLVRGALLWLRDVSALETGQVLAARLRKRLLDRMAELGPGHRWTGGPASAHLLLVDGCEHLRGYVGTYLPQLVASLLVPATLVGILAGHDLSVALLVAVMVAVTPTSHRLLRRLLGERAQAHWESYERYAAKISDSIAGLETLAGLGRARRRGEQLTAEAEQLRRSTTANMNASLSGYLAVGSAMLLGTAGATSLAAWHSAQGRLAPASAVLVLFLAAECFRPLVDLQNYWHEGFYGLSAAREIAVFEAQQPPVPDQGTDEPAAGAADLVLDEVSFRYPGATREALSQVSVTFPAGQITAVVGPSGSGKSTLVSLLLRDQDPVSGSVSSGGVDLRQLRLTSWRGRSARVSQDVVLLDGTVRDNLLASCPEASPQLLADALSRSRVDEILPSLPQGLDSPVGEGGRLLSGGQRQRVALARALLRQAPLLVLDEATSALDGENEAWISTALRENRDQATIVVVAHRLSTVRNADQVLVLDQGRVVEAGPPAQLEQAGGAWAAMVAAQDVRAEAVR